MKSRTTVTVIIAFSLLNSSEGLAGDAKEPLSGIPAEQREGLSKRLVAYVKAYKARKWDALYDLISETGKGTADRRMFAAAMAAEHGKEFAQMPDLLEFTPDRNEESDHGFDIYGCGKAQREGMKFSGIVVMHAVREHDDWLFTGWTFTEFPNEPCKALTDPKWQPRNQMTWNRPMDEVTNFKSQGSSFHVDPPH